MIFHCSCVTRSHKLASAIASDTEPVNTDLAIYIKFPLFSPRNVFSCFPSLFLYQRRRRHVTGSGRRLPKKKGNLSRHNVRPRDFHFETLRANHMSIQPSSITSNHALYLHSFSGFIALIMTEVSTNQHICYVIYIIMFSLSMSVWDCLLFYPNQNYELWLYKTTTFTRNEWVFIFTFCWFIESVWHSWSWYFKPIPYLLTFGACDHFVSTLSQDPVHWMCTEFVSVHKKRTH